jgi:hypothetical protein
MPENTASKRSYDEVEYKGYRYNIPRGEFDPEGDDYDYKTAFAVDMDPVTEGPNEGHLWTTALLTPEQAAELKLPEGSRLILKGRKHETWDLGVAGEEENGFKVIKFGERYYSVPKEWMP